MVSQSPRSALPRILAIHLPLIVLVVLVASRMPGDVQERVEVGALLSAAVVSSLVGVLISTARVEGGRRRTLAPFMIQGVGVATLAAAVTVRQQSAHPAMLAMAVACIVTGAILLIRDGQLRK